MRDDQRTAASATYVAVLQELLADMSDRYARAEAILRDHECDPPAAVIDAEMGHSEV